MHGVYVMEMSEGVELCQENIGRKLELDMFPCYEDIGGEVE